MENSVEKVEIVPSDGEKEAQRLRSHYLHALSKIKDLIRICNYTEGERVYQSIRISLRRYALHNSDDISTSFRMWRDYFKKTRPDMSHV